MTDKDFDIKIIDLNWAQKEDDPTDLCAHGHVHVKIGNEVVADKDTFELTLSSTALHLMRTITCDYKKGDFGNQLLPCCGHFLIADETMDFITICGCPSGIDWTIIHIDDQNIKHITERGQEAIISKEKYIKLVLDFADQIEQFYKMSKSKIIPTDDFDRRGYLAFWNEWRILRDPWD